MAESLIQSIWGARPNHVLGLNLHFVPPARPLGPEPQREHGRNADRSRGQHGHTYCERLVVAG